MYQKTLLNERTFLLASEIQAISQRQHMQRIASFLRLVTTAVLVVTLVLLPFSMDCATGGSCALANGDLANWLFPKLQMLRGWLQ